MNKPAEPQLNVMKLETALGRAVALIQSLAFELAAEYEHRDWAPAGLMVNGILSQAHDTSVELERVMTAYQLDQKAARTI